MPIKNVFIDGEFLYLRALEKNDLEGEYKQWLNDPLITQFNSHGRFPNNNLKMEDYFHFTQTSNNALVLAIIDKKTNNHVGNISLQNINWIDRSAEFAILLGSSTIWGKGYGYESAKLIINHGFEKLNLHRIYCGTSSQNIGMQKLALKLKMKLEGERLEAIFKNGVYFNIIEYGILNK
jgi:ribosomal-protein-alanine N-acetyltransferase